MDGLSGAASAIAVVSLAMQLGDSVQKLCNFLSAVRNASEDIADIVDDLSVLMLVLQDIQRMEEQFGPHNATDAALQRCRRKVHALEAMVQAWRTETEKASGNALRRNQVALKAVLKSDRVKEFRRKIEEAKSTLLLAQQVSTSRFQRSQFLAVMQGVGSLECQNTELKAMVTTAVDSSSYTVSSTSSESVTASVAAAASSLVPPDIDSAAVALGAPVRTLPLRRSVVKREREGSRIKGFFGCLQYDYEEQDIETTWGDNSIITNCKSKVGVSFRPSCWLTKLGFRMCLHASLERSSLAGWDISLKTVNVIPNESQIFRYSCDGNLEKVRELICTGKASAMDINEDGITPLWFAASKFNADVCAFLIEAGANPLTGYELFILASIVSQAEPTEKAAVMNTLRNLSLEEFFFETPSRTLLDLACLVASIGLPQFDDAYDEAPSFWLLRKMLPALQADREISHLVSWVPLLAILPWTHENRPVFELIFRNCDTEAKQWALMFKIKNASTADTSLGDYARRLLEEAEDPHSILRTGFEFTPTLLSHALEFGPEAIQILFRLLDLLGVSIEEFVSRQMSLWRQVEEPEARRWNERKISFLFNWDYNRWLWGPEGPDLDGICTRCCSSLDKWFCQNELWSVAVDRVGAGKDPEGPYDEEERKVVEKYERYRKRWRTEHICFDCQEELEEAEPETELETSPFLLDIW